MPNVRDGLKWRKDVRRDMSRSTSLYQHYTLFASIAERFMKDLLFFKCLRQGKPHVSEPTHFEYLQYAYVTS